MTLIESIKRRIPWVQEAAPAKLLGRPIVKQTTYAANTRERNITPALLVEDRNVAPAISAIGGLSGLCFSGFDWILKPLEEGNEEAVEKKIYQVLPEIKRLDSQIGRVGKARNVGTLGLIRRSFLEGYTFRQVVVEYATIRDGSWLNFADIQILPGETFATMPPSLAGQERYVADKILPGIVADSQDDDVKFYQSLGMGKTQELDPENVLYIQDNKIPDNTSLIKAIVPSIEAWKEVRYDSMLTMHRVGSPNQVAQLDARDLVLLKDADLIGGPNQPTLGDIKEYAEDIVQNQGIDRAQMSLAGMKLQYPNVSIPINPWEADALLRKEIMDFFFHTDILQVTAQAISATTAPSKELLDNHIAGERETYGQPFEALWNDWLEWNGFDLVLELGWWNWAPKDQEAEKRAVRDDLTAGIITINEAREKNGHAPLSEEPDDTGKTERDLLYEELKARKGGQSPVVSPE